MAEKLHCDFETRSEVDLKKFGVAVYAKHPSTKILMMSWAFDDEEPALWLPGEPFPWSIKSHVYNGFKVVAFNVGFEIWIWNYLLYPKIKELPPLHPNQCDDLAARAMAMALPPGLGRVAQALGLEHDKDGDGYKLMLEMCKPLPGPLKEGRIIYENSPEKMKRLGEYCCNDVVVDQELDGQLLSLSAREQKIWELDFKINARGFRIDRPTVENAHRMVQKDTTRINKLLKENTNGVITAVTQHQRLSQWLAGRVDNLEGCSKDKIVEYLKQPLILADTRLVLELRQEGGKTSTSKLAAMLNASPEDDRLRGCILYHGASTGRWAGRRVQPHNLFKPREGVSFGNIQNVIDLVLEGDLEGLKFFHGKPIPAIADSLRCLIIPDQGKVFDCADFKSIEGRGLCWLAGDTVKLDKYRNQDADPDLPDMYEETYASMYGVDPRSVTKAQRAIGKIGELALGFGGGKGALQRMGAKMGMVFSDDEAESLKLKWRAANPLVVKLWDALEEAAIYAVRNPGSETHVGQISFKKIKSFLYMRLPSGRLLSYPFAHMGEVEYPWGGKGIAICYKTMYENAWINTSTYGGKIAENADQALCRDILADALVRLDAAGFDLVLHIHDETVAETDTSRLAEMIRIMCQETGYTEGFPIAADGWTGVRYRK